MKRPIKPSSPLLPALVLVALTSGGYLQGFVSVGHTWSTETVRYYVNPHSLHVSQQAAVSAIQTAAAGWNEQSRANIRLVYAGPTSAFSLAMNHKNEVFFRNEAKGSTVGEAWYWWDGSGRLVDADIVLYEGAYPLFAFSGCEYGVYIENVAIHEFGHALGLWHSDESGVTMQAAMDAYCDTSQLTLEADDIAGIEALYPPPGTASPPSLPSSPSLLSLKRR